MYLFSKQVNSISYTNSVGDKVYPILVDIKRGIQSTETLSFMTSDINTGFLSIAFIEGEQDYNIGGAKVMCTILRPDATTLYLPCNIISSNIVEVPLGINGTHQEGTYQIDFKIFKSNNKIIGTPLMNYTVQRSIDTTNDIEGDDRVPILTTLITTVTNKINDVERFVNELETVTADSVLATNNAVDATNKANTTIDSISDRFENLIVSQGKDAEVIEARGGERSLKDRIDKFGSQLERYVDDALNKTEIVSLADDVSDMVNTSQNYVHTGTKTWWKHKRTLVSGGGIHEYVDNALDWSITDVVLNKRLTTSGSEADAPGSAVIYFNFDKIVQSTTTVTMSNIASKSKYIALSLKVLSGISITDKDIADYVITMNNSETNLLKSGAEVLLNTRYKHSSAEIVSDLGYCLLLIPIEINNEGKCEITLRNIPSHYVTEAQGTSIYLLDANKSNPLITNGSNYIASMTQGVTSDDVILDNKLYEIQQKLLNKDPIWVRMKGCSIYVTAGNDEFCKVSGWTASDKISWKYFPDRSVLLHEESDIGIHETPLDSTTIPYTDRTVAPVYAFKFGYFNKVENDKSTNTKVSDYKSVAKYKFALSVIMDFAGRSKLTELHLRDTYITFDSPIIQYEDAIIEGWYDTGIPYNPGDNGSIAELLVDTADLNHKANELEDRVVYLEDIQLNGANAEKLPTYWKDRLDEIKPKIDAIQREYGMDAFQFLWASDIHGVPGSAPSNTTELGRICRYMMDTHNIPFVALSGDIMSQASHTNVDAIWNEYVKLNDMFSIIKNEEFLAVRGNHDGAWGDSQLNEKWLKSVGNKELFNSIYRRQSLDRNRVFGKDGTYFYIDCPYARFYMLNTHTDGDGSKDDNDVPTYHSYKHYVLGNEQLNWIANSLLTVRDGQKVVFMGHTPIRACVDGSIFTGILNAYKNRVSYVGNTVITGDYWGTDEKYTKVEVDVDFTSTKGDLIGYFHGHTHIDRIQADGEFPVIGITTAGGDQRDSYLVNKVLTRTKGTATETSIDLVSVTTDYIYFTRIGCGYDRKYNRITKEITIDYDSAYNPSTYSPTQCENTLA